MKKLTVPEHLVVIGGGYVAPLFAQVYRRFGAEVRVIEATPRLIPREDEDISIAIREVPEAEEVRVLVGANGLSVASAHGGVRVSLDAGSANVTVEGTRLLLAVERRPNTIDLGLVV